MTQNIEQRTESAVSKYEGAAKSADELVHTDKDVQTPVGVRKSFPKIAREADEGFNNQRQSHEQSFQNRWSISQQAIDWQPQMAVSDSLQRYSVGTVGNEDYKEYLPSSEKLPFTTNNTIAEDLLSGYWVENGVPSKSWTESYVGDLAGIPWKNDADITDSNVRVVFRRNAFIAPTASPEVPVKMGTTPFGDVNFQLADLAFSGPMSGSELEALTLQHPKKRLSVSSNILLDKSIKTHCELMLDESSLIAGPHAIDIGEDLIAGDYQIFADDVNVTAKAGVIKGAYGNWFGAIADGYEYEYEFSSTGATGDGERVYKIDGDTETYTVNGNTYSFGQSPSDAYTDATLALQKVLNLNSLFCFISKQNKPYMIDTTGNNPYDGTRGGLLWRDKFGLELIISATLKAIPNSAANTNVLRVYSTRGCKVHGGGELIGDLMEHPEGDGSWEGGMGIYAAANFHLDLEGLQTRFMTGDGTFFTYPRTADDDYLQKHITLRGMVSEYCRRTGHVVELGDYFYHYNCKWNKGSKWRGIATFSGVDVEPLSYADTPIRYADQIHFYGCDTSHNEKGVGLRMEKVLNGSVQAHTSNHNANGLATIECGTGNRDNPTPDNRLFLFGGITIDGLTCEGNTFSAITGGITKPSRVLATNMFLTGNRRDFTGYWFDSQFANITSMNCQSHFLAIDGAERSIWRDALILNLKGDSDANKAKIELDIYGSRGINDLELRNLRFALSAAATGEPRLDGVNCSRWFLRAHSTGRNIKLIDNFIDPRHNYAETIRSEGAHIISRSSIMDEIPARALKNDKIQSDNYQFGEAVCTQEGTTGQFGFLWTSSKSLYKGQFVRTSADRHYVVLEAGTSGSTEPTVESEWLKDGTATLAHICNLAEMIEVNYA